MQADEQTRAEIEGLVKETYRRMSTPGDDPGELFGHPDMTVAGSGQGELMYGVNGQVDVPICGHEKSPPRRTSQDLVSDPPPLALASFIR